jgi:LysW-gamma-L-lysine carboxypeptidase
MKEFGFDAVTTDDAGNALGEIGHGARHVLLCGNMDTVPGETPVGFRDGHLYGRGAVDAKSAMCAFIAAAARVRTVGRPRVSVACVTNEESDSRGIKEVMKHGQLYDFAIFGEPGGAGRITVGYRGRVAAVVSVKTEGGHASSPWLHKNSIEESFALFERFREYEKAHQVGQDHYNSLSLCLTKILGGSYHNVIPADCTFTIDVRIPRKLAYSQVCSDLRQIVSKFAADRAGVVASVQFEEPTPSYEADRNSSLVRAFQRAIITNLNKRPVFVHKTATSDMNEFASAFKIPCVTYGPGDPLMSHVSNEEVSIADYNDSINVLSGALSYLALSG